MLVDNCFELPDLGRLGHIFPGADGHACLGVDRFVHFGTDAGIVVGDLLTFVVKVDAPGVRGCHG